MVYLKANGGNGFSWQKQLDYLKREDPDNLEEITHAKLMALKQQQPDKADYYEELDNQLIKIINDAIDETPAFGFDHAQAITRAFISENDLESFVEEPETPTHSYWCYPCNDFTPHKAIENGNTYCLTCHRERESALTRYIPDDKRPVENPRYVVSGYYNDRSYYLAEGGKWSRFKFQAKQFNSKREALEARETTPRPIGDFYPGLMELDDRDQDFPINDENETLTIEDEIFDYLTAKEDFEAWEPQGLEETTDPITTPRRWGERQIPGLAEFHDAIASMANPDGTFRRERGNSDDV